MLTRCSCISLPIQPHETEAIINAKGIMLR